MDGTDECRYHVRFQCHDVLVFRTSPDGVTCVRVLAMPEWLDRVAETMRSKPGYQVADVCRSAFAGEVADRELAGSYS